jgi:predicted kinase
MEADQAGLPAQPEVVLMCGVAGSGKTAYAKDLETRGYVRLSVDEEIWRRFGSYGVDYAPDLYDEHTEVARRVLRERLLSLVAQGSNVVIDSSFWQRSRRQEYKELIEQAGGRWRLIYLEIDPALLRQRLHARAERCDANAAFPITDKLLTHYPSCLRATFRRGRGSHSGHRRLTSPERAGFRPHPRGCPTTHLPPTKRAPGRRDSWRFRGIPRVSGQMVQSIG